MTSNIFLAAALSLVTVAPVAAATLDERGAPNGDFSDSFTQPTVIASDVRTVIGGQNAPVGHVQDVDVLKFEGFGSGAERLDFSFTNPLGGWGGFNLRIKGSPFSGQGDWYPLLDHVGISGVSDSNPVSFSFDIRGIQGPLYLAFEFFDADFISGSGVRYEITQIGADRETSDGPLPSPIPLPPAGALMLAGLGAFALVRRRKRG